MEIRAWAETDTAGFRELFASCFGREIGEDYCRWKFDTNPAGEAIRYVAFENAQVVGCVNFIPLRLWIEGEKTIAYQSVDTMVHPELRRQGLFSALTQTALGEMSRRGGLVKVNFPGSESYPGYLKLNHQLLMHFEYWFHLDTVTGLRRAARVRTPRGPDEGAIAVCLPKNVERISFFGPAVDRLWESARRKWRVIQERSSEALQWRYYARPDRRYSCYGYLEGGECLGYVIVQGAKLVDLLTTGHPQVMDSLLRAARCHQALTHEAVQHVWLSPGAVERRAWLRRRWRQVRVWHGKGPFYPKQPVCLYLLDSHTAVSKVLMAPGNWYLTMGDTDWA